MPTAPARQLPGGPAVAATQACLCRDASISWRACLNWAEINRFSVPRFSPSRRARAKSSSMSPMRSGISRPRRQRRDSSGGASPSNNGVSPDRATARAIKSHNSRAPPSAPPCQHPAWPAPALAEHPLPQPLHQRMCVRQLGRRGIALRQLAKSRAQHPEALRGSPLKARRQLLGITGVRHWFRQAGKKTRPSLRHGSDQQRRSTDAEQPLGRRV